MTEHEVGLLDTSAVILLPAIRDASLLPGRSLISSITLAELSVGPLATDDAVERERRQAQLQQVETDFDPLPFDADAARAFGRIAGALRRSGGKVRARSYDAMIAATAVANGLPLYTANPRDFAGIDELTVVPIETVGP